MPSVDEVDDGVGYGVYGRSDRGDGGSYNEKYNNRERKSRALKL
jgi:hypothetical protein